MTTTTGSAGNLAARLEHRGDHRALVLEDRTVTHEQLADRVARWRGGLATADIVPGRRVAIVAGPGELLVAAHLAVVGVGAVSVPLNPDCPPVELLRELRSAAVEAVVADEAGRAVVEAALALPQAGGVSPALLDPTVLDAGSPSPIVAVDGSDPAVLLFTSGTAGAPRPALLTHDNLTAALQSVLSLPSGLLDKPHVFLGVVPLFHVLGLNIVLHLALAIRATVVLSPYRGPTETIDLIEANGVTVALGPPNLWQALTRVEGLDPARVASVDLALSGAAALPGLTRVAAAERLGIHLDEGYGLTESGAVVASTVTVDAPPGSVGRLAPGVEARIIDEDGADCLVGDPGELLVRGAMIFPGYWTPDGLDRGPLTDDGWLKTGDLAMVDDDGNLAIVGRLKDLVIVSGFNVYPAEVEAVLLDHPDVADAGVVGEPSPETGEAVVAFVVPATGRRVDGDELRQHCRTELARYKVPVRVVVADNLPIGPTGKLQRVRLR